MKNRMRMLLIFSLAAVISALLPLTGSAAAVIDHEESGAFDIAILSPDKNEPVAGAELELFYVGAIIDDSSYNIAFVPGGDFIGAGVSFSDLTASNSILAAKALKAYAQSSGISGEVKATGSDGKVLFDSLELGLYLVVPREFKAGSPYENLDPFLAGVPVSNAEGTEWEYSVDVCPKIEIKPVVTTAKPVVTSTEPAETKPADKLPQTGALRWPVPVLAVSGILLFSIGWADLFIRRKSTDE